MQATNTPSLSDLKALDGRDFATLSQEELLVLKFYRARGRKFDVSVTINSTADPAELAAASMSQADEIMRRCHSPITVVVGATAEAAWAERARADS